MSGAPFFGDRWGDEIWILAFFDDDDVSLVTISAILLIRHHLHHNVFLTMMSPPRLTAAATVLLFVLTGVSSAWQTTVRIPHQYSRKTSHLTVLHSASPYSGDDAVAQLPLLEAQLATSTLLTDDGRQDLEEKISNAKMSAEFGVRKAQADFYEAFSNANVEAMDDVWSSKSTVRCVHPGMESLNGKELVMKSWAQVFSNENSFAVTPLRTVIDICGQTAICSCVEETPNGGQLEALNVYHREDGSWRMTLHMASPILMRQKDMRQQ